MAGLNVGVIGLGVGEAHIEGYNAHPGCRVVAVCDFDEAKCTAAAQKYPGVRITKEAQDILTAADIDIVSIASFDNYHYEQVIQALQHDKHVFVEKPICLYEPELADIRAALAANPNLRLSSNLILRKCRRFQNLKKRIARGEFGELYFVEGDYNYGRLEKITQGWRGKLDFCSVVYGGAIHMVDLLLWLTGQKVTRVSAVGTQIASRATTFKHNDMVVALLEFENGMLGKVAANFGCVGPHFHGLRLYGTARSFENGRDTAVEYTARDTAATPRINTDPYPGYHKSELVTNFVDTILGKCPAEVTADEVFAVMSVCLAIEKAAAASNGKAVAVAYA